MASGPHGMGDADWDGGRVKEVPSSKVRPIDDYSMSSSMAFLMHHARAEGDQSSEFAYMQSMTPKLSPRSSSGR